MQQFILLISCFIVAAVCLDRCVRFLQTHHASKNVKLTATIKFKEIPTQLTFEDYNLLHNYRCFVVYNCIMNTLPTKNRYNILNSINNACKFRYKIRYIFIYFISYYGYFVFIFVTNILS